MEIHADFWPGQRFSKKLFWRRGLYLSFSNAFDCQWVEKSSMWRFMWRKREFYGVIWRGFARVEVLWVVCGRVVIAAKVIYFVIYRRCWQVCGWARVTRKLCAKHKNASWVFSVGDFALESLFCAQRLWILNLVFSAETWLWASWFDWLKSFMLHVPLHITKVIDVGRVLLWVSSVCWDTK